MRDRAACTDQAPETIAALLRGFLVAAVSRRPVFHLSGPVTRVTLDHDALGPTLTAEAALSEIGLRRLVVRPLPRRLDETTLEHLTEPAIGRADTAVAVVAGELQAATVPGATGSAGSTALRDLVHLARTTETPDEFDAAVRRSNAGFRSSAAGTVDAAARGLLVALYRGEVTDARRRGLHLRLRSLLVPRAAELARVLRLAASGTDAERRVDELHYRAMASRPAFFEHVAGPPDAPRPAGRIMAIPGLGGHAEDGTRLGELSLLAACFADRTAPARAAIIAESGMGKSSLAARACRKLASGYPIVGWLSATDSLAWTTSRGALAARLGLPDDSAEALWRELAEQGPALIVIDDAPGPEQFSSLPDLPGVHTLITSQSAGWRAASEVVELSPMPLGEAAEYLLVRTGARDERLVRDVAGTLGGFPPAIEQAAVAIIEGVSMSGWLDRHRADPSYGTAALRDIWEVRLRQLRNAHPNAALLLRTLACAGPAPVPAGLLDKLGDDFPEDVTLPFAADRAHRDAAVAELRRQGLIRTGVEVETFQLHPLLAQVIRDNRDFDVADTAMRVGGAASWLMNRYDPEDVSTWPVVAALVSTAVAACTLVFQELRNGYSGLPDQAPEALADCALWPAAGHLLDMGAYRATYRTRLLALALYGDPAAAEAVARWSGEVSAQFSDLRPDDVVPAAELGRVSSPHARLFAARWINENATMLADFDIGVALDYARRALEVAPRSVPSAGTAQAIPWGAQVRIEILDNLAWVEMLHHDYETADRTFARAQRLRRAYPDPEHDEKYGQLINDRALVHLDRGEFERARAGFERSAAVLREAHGPEAAVLDNIENNLARAEHKLWWLRSAASRLEASLDRLWDRLDPRNSEVLIQQCNTGLVNYDLGETETGYRLVEGAWRTLGERLGWDDRETLIRRTMLAELRRYQGDLAAELSALKRAVEADPSQERSPWPRVHRLQAAWLSGAAALTPESARRLALPVIEAFGGRGTHAAMAWDLLTVHALAGAGDHGPDAEDCARRAVALHRRTVGPDHPATLLAHARAALLRAGRDRSLPLRRTGARRLLRGLDSFTRPGSAGFDADLARYGQPPIDPARPGWEADRLMHLLEDGVVELGTGARLMWTANAGRLTVLAGRNGTGRLRAAAQGSAALYGVHHPWNLLREACAAVADDDHDALRAVLCEPYWV